MQLASRSSSLPPPLAPRADKESSGSEQPAAAAGPEAPAASGAAAQVAEALPGQDAVQLPKEVIERLRYTVFGFDTFWVTQVDNYDQDGVVFKGNVRGRDPAVAFQKMKQRMKVRVRRRLARARARAARPDPARPPASAPALRPSKPSPPPPPPTTTTHSLQAELGDRYRLFLLEDKEEKPTAVVLPLDAANEGTISRFTEVRRRGERAAARPAAGHPPASPPILMTPPPPLGPAARRSGWPGCLRCSPP